MPEDAKPSVARRVKKNLVVSTPGVKFAIGTVASMCAVFVPRLLAALTSPARGDFEFVSAEYTTVALAFSVIMGLVVAVFEWRVPRAPRDTFMATLGIPAILAGALTGNQSAAQFRELQKQAEGLAEALAKLSGISIEASLPGNGQTGATRPAAWFDAIVPTVYASALQAPVNQAQRPRLGIQVKAPLYYVVLDRAGTEQDARLRARRLTQRFGEPTPRDAPRLDVRQQGASFLVVAGDPQIRSAALLEAVRLKERYQIGVSLVPVRGAD